MGAYDVIAQGQNSGNDNTIGGVGNSTSGISKRPACVHKLLAKFKDAVMIPSWGPPNTHTVEQKGYDKEELFCMHITSDKEEQKDYEPGQDSWQISHLVSAD